MSTTPPSRPQQGCCCHTRHAPAGGLPCTPTPQVSPCSADANTILSPHTLQAADPPQSHQPCPAPMHRRGPSPSTNAYSTPLLCHFAANLAGDRTGLRPLSQDRGTPELRRAFQYCLDVALQVHGWALGPVRSGCTAKCRSHSHVKPCGGVSHASPHGVTFVRLRDPLAGPFEGQRLVA